MSNIRIDQIEQLAQTFRALSNPNRLRIFLRLVSCCEPGTRYRTDGETCACVGELGRDLGIAPSTVSHHIKELHQAGLIRMQRRGQHVECWIDTDALRMVGSFPEQPVSR